MESLRPTFQGASGEIPLDRPLVAIGCAEPPFAGYAEALRAQLCERHARIIRERDGLYLIALDGAGATAVNGRAVARGGEELNLGDVVQFGESLTFEVAASDAPANTQSFAGAGAALLKLLLLPKSEQGPEAPIAVNEFPFLVAKNDGHFASYEQECKEAFSFLSRRHAHVFRQGDALFVEDLGSTNGTRLNGELIGKSATRIESGDELTFGHPAFAFEAVVIDGGRDEVQEDPEGTVLISSAGSFLDIYCDAGSDEQAAGAEEASVPPGAAGKRLAAPLGDAAARVRADVRRRWLELPLGRQARTGLAYALLALVFAFGLLLLLRDDRLQDAQAELDAGRYDAALALAASYASEHPDDTQGSRMLETAYERFVLPGWIGAMQVGDIDAAAALLQGALAIAPQQEDEPLTSLLRWIGRLDALARPAEQRGPVSAAFGNDAVRAVLDHWDSHADPYTRLLRRLSDAYSDMAALHARTSSDLRRLQAQGAAQLEAVRELTARLDTYLDSARFADAVSLVERFGRDYPRVADVDALSRDLARFRALAEARGADALDAFLAASAQWQLETPLFAARAEPLLALRPEAEETQRRLGEARASWQSGELQRAIAVLEEAGGGAWQSAVNGPLARYRDLRERFSGLLDIVQTEAYPEAVIAFYGGLDPDADAFMYAALQEDFWSHKERALAQAGLLAEQGAALWSEYQAAYEGIGGGLRLEREVSEAFRRQAALLSQCQDVLNRSLRLYRLLNQEAPQAVRAHGQEVANEVQRQRGAIEALRSILERDVLEEKLRLLPEVAGA
jgi:pSer/pThr/pTyr-binding forkhead associated (FHA) protein